MYISYFDTSEQILSKDYIELILFQISKSSSNLQEITYNGRPKGEEPHVKRSVKKKQEQIEYIVRVDLVSSKLKCRNNSCHLNKWEVFNA